MNAAHNTAQHPTAADLQHGDEGAGAAHDDDDFDLGWECANPALQIEVWCLEATAQPLQRFF